MRPSPRKAATAIGMSPVPWSISVRRGEAGHRCRERLRDGLRHGPSPVLLGDDLDPPGALPAERPYGPDEVGDREVALAAEPAPEHGVLVAGADLLGGAVIELDPGDIF